jgi:regulatory protein
VPMASRSSASDLGGPVANASKASQRPTPAEDRERRAAVDDPAVVLEAAARFLEARSRSVTEVRRRLGRAGYQAELVDSAITRLTELGMLDDEAFGRAWVESRDRARPRGEIALRRELALKGVDRAIVDSVLEERRDAGGAPTDGEGVDLEVARRLVARHERSLARVADPRQRHQRAYALLARNGFDPETCRVVASAVALALSEDDDGATSPAEG